MKTTIQILTLILISLSLIDPVAAQSKIKVKANMSVEDSLMREFPNTVYSSLRSVLSPYRKDWCPLNGAVITPTIG